MKISSLSVVVPAFNEKRDLEATIETILAALETCLEDYEIVVVDDGSTDGTREIAQGLAKSHAQVRVIHNEKNEGLGASYLKGVAQARKERVVFVPADNGFCREALVSVFSRLKDAELVSTYPANSQVRSLLRRLISRSYVLSLNRLFGRHMRYYNGLVVYPREFFDSKPVTTHGFAFMAEALISALERGYTCLEIGVPIHDRQLGRSKAFAIRNILSVVDTVARLFWRLRVKKQRKGMRV